MDLLLLNQPNGQPWRSYLKTSNTTLSLYSQLRQQPVSYPKSPMTYKSQSTSSHCTHLATTIQRDWHNQQRT